MRNVIRCELPRCFLWLYTHKRPAWANPHTSLWWMRGDLGTKLGKGNSPTRCTDVSLGPLGPRIVLGTQEMKGGGAAAREEEDGPRRTL